MTDPKNTNDSSVHSEDFTDGFLTADQRLQLEHEEKKSKEYSYFASEEWEREQSRHETLLFIEQNQPNDY